MRQFRLSLIAILASATMAACGDDEASQPDAADPCGEAETRNPVTQECELAVNNGADDAGSSTNNGGEDTGSTNNGGQPDSGDASDAGDNDPDIGSNDDMGQTPDSGVDMGGSDPNFVRFVAMGDTGEGNAEQYQVGQSIGTVCGDLGGCDFGLLLGDNFYDSGVDSVNDMLFDSMFAQPYGHLNFPFYVVLGNHDLGGGGLGLDLDTMKDDYQIQYSQRNPQWIMPDEYYKFEFGPIWMVGLNTTDIFFDVAEQQEQDVQTWMSSAPADRWKIAFGHHPYISNGPHGNAGEYEGLPFVPIANGKAVEDFMDDNVCGKFDLYVCGHDHSRQDLGEACGTQFVVSGAGAKTTELDGDNPTHFEKDTEGFALFEVWTNEMKIHFYDAAGTLEHSRTITR